ncbi:hypothetical protein ACOME3_003476 [Neoechinorhynchus agilis]
MLSKLLFSIPDVFAIILVATVASLTGELLTYALVYRTDRYKRLCAEMDRHHRKLTSVAGPGADPNGPQGKRQKRLERHEQSLLTNSREMTSLRMKSMLAVSLTFMVLFGSLSRLYQGKVVARLPFLPIKSEEPLFEQLDYEALHTQIKTYSIFNSSILTGN